MSEQIKPRTIKTIVQKEPSEKPPAINNVMIYNQYTAIINNLKIMTEMLEYIIAQPNEKKPKSNGEEAKIVDPSKPRIATPVWEKSEDQLRKEREPAKEKQPKEKKPGKGKVMLFLILAITGLGLVIYLITSVMKGYVLWFLA